MNHPVSFAYVSGQPFVKRFVLSYQTVVRLSCPICDVGVLWINGGSRCYLVRR